MAASVIMSMHDRNDPLSSDRFAPNDHDLLIGLRAEMKGMREDVQEIKAKVQDDRWKNEMQKRIDQLENWRWKVVGIAIGASATLSAITGLVVKLTS